MQHEFKVDITETVTRSVWVTADDPTDARRIAEENYTSSDVTDVEFEVDPLSRRYSGERKMPYEKNL